MSASVVPQETIETAVGLMLDAQAAPHDEILRARIDLWISISPAHQSAWDIARRTWQTLGDVQSAALLAAPQPGNVVPITAARNDERTRAGRRIGLSLTGLAAAAALALLVSPSLTLRLSTDHATRTAELRDIRLEDGSLVRLGARSAIDVRYSDAERRVTLVAGDAWFDVAHNPARPFIVEADGTETRVLGTAFEVRRRLDGTEVGLVRGRVRLSAVGAARALDLKPGDQAFVDRSGAMHRDIVPPESIASWRDGHLFANNATVAEVIGELRRYDRGWIILADDAFAAKRVTGLYDARQPAEALNALIETAGGSLSTLGPIAIVRGR